jgi:3-hydroxyacyl-CoA dehydrogenase
MNEQGSAGALVRWERHGDIAVVTIDNPPLNALAASTSSELVGAVERSERDTSVVATVIVGANATFVAGADIRRLGGQAPAAASPQPRASETLDLSAKPVVAAIDGFAIGGGLEIALACHGRVATARAEFGLGETLIGVIPGGGGTQRLPRVVGIGRALEIIQSGRRISAAEALALDIVDLVEDDPSRLEAVAADFARRLAARGSLPRIRDIPLPGTAADHASAFAEARRRADSTKAGNRLALHAAVDAVEAAVLLGFEDGMRREQALFAGLVDSGEAKALRYAFFAEREARKVPGMPKADGRTPARAAVVGAGTMGTGIAMAFADAGIPVALIDRDAVSVRRGMERIASTWEASVRRGSLQPAERDARLARVTPVRTWEELSGCDVAVEAVFEDVALKRDVFARLDAVMPAGALLLSNTSTIDIGLIAQGHRRAGDIAGAHFFSPANVMKLVEVVDGPQTRPMALARTFALSRRLGKIPAVAGSCDGFVANRCRAPFQTEYQIMVEEGASPEQVDRVMMEFGFAIGPFMVGDIAGLDIGHAVRRLNLAKDPGFRMLPIPDRLYDLGRYGQKTGAGWYRYEKGSRTPLSDPVVAEVIEAVSRERGIARRAIADDEVLMRPLLLAVNEACRILAEGMAVRPGDIDVMWLHGFAFPRQRGGLMFWADTLGPRRIVEAMERYEAEHGARFEPCSLLRDLALRDARFASIETRWRVKA